MNAETKKAIMGFQTSPGMGTQLMPNNFTVSQMYLDVLLCYIWLHRV